MLMQSFRDAGLAQYAYLIGCQRTGEAVVVDPERDVDRYIAAAEAEGLGIVAVAETATQAKSPFFELDERLEMIREVFRDEPRVEAESFQGLLVEFARRRGARFLIRGLRAVSDFEYEFQMAQMNRQLWDEVETLFLTPAVEHAFLSASLVREVALLGGDVEEFVSPPVLRRMQAKLG